MPAKKTRHQPPRKPRSSSPLLQVKSTERVAGVASTTVKDKGKGPTRSKYFEDVPGQPETSIQPTRQAGRSKKGPRGIDEGGTSTGDNEEEQVVKGQGADDGVTGYYDEESEARRAELEEHSNSNSTKAVSAANTHTSGDEDVNAIASRKRIPLRTKSEIKSRKKIKPLAEGSDVRAIASPTGEIFIPNQVLDIWNVEYKDETVHPNTLEFLRELAKNNDRSWFADHDSLFRAAKQDFERLVEKISDKIIEEIDQTVPELPLKDLVFRIYRDIRFSNDQTPYKVYFSAAWSRTGRKGPYAHYYLQIQPNDKSFVGGGIWQADARRLDLIRREIDRNPHQLKSILARSGIAKEFLDLKEAGNEVEAVKAFAGKNAEDALKTAPKNYAKTHADIELLRLRSFTVGRQLKDDEVISASVLHRIADLFVKMEPLISYLNSVVMPDINTDANESSAED